NDRGSIRFEPVAERERGMIEIAGGDLDLVDIERAFDQVVISDRGRELIGRHRKIGVLHLTGQRLAQGLVETLGAIDVPLTARNKQRREERNALDVIPMRVTDEDAAAQGFAVRSQLLPERMSARAAIDDNQSA